jgi:benzylsuccinate CoA-transferase BbsF subunit
MAQCPLAGYRVVDFGSAWAGPQMAHILADLGAEVIKVESRTRIDYGRIGGAASSKDVVVKTPEAIAAVDPDRLELNPVFHLLNRGKKGITVDFARPEGTELVRELVKRSDVVADNFTPGVLEKYGLGYNDLARVKPDIVVVSMCFAGHTGPLKGTRGYAPIITALSGFDSFVGYPDETVPCGPRFAFGDHVAAMHGAVAALIALVHRNRTGEGQYIDISEWEATTSLLGEPLMEYLMNGRIPGPTGNRDTLLAPHGYYPCREGGWVSLALKTDDEWQALCKAMGNPSWCQDERFGDGFGRLTHSEELDRLLSQWTAGLTAGEITAALQKAGVAAAPFLTSRAQYHDPHLRHRGVFVEVTHPKVGKETFYGIPWKLSDTPGEVKASGPTLGQDNEYVFKEVLGLSDSEYDRLVAERIIY